MSILVQDPVDQHIKLFVKGADSIILDRLETKGDKKFLKEV